MTAWRRRRASSFPHDLLMRVREGMFCHFAIQDQEMKQGTCLLMVNFKKSTGLRSVTVLGSWVTMFAKMVASIIAPPSIPSSFSYQLLRLHNGKDPGKFRQLDEILYVEGYPGYQQLMNVSGHHMELVCEVKEVANMKFFRLDDSKVLSWLCCKVHNLKEVFPKLGKNYAAQLEKEQLKEAVQMIREYLKDEPWVALLCKKLQLDTNEINDATTKTNEASFCADSCPAPAPPSESKAPNSSAKSSKGRPAKKPKVEVGSKNIKDMFRRVTRSGSGS
ncbi:unnamed protein product [Urochloa decumbens]|uniref:Ribonuclease H2 subunit B wHTH domain-containing protein n=1 Tax=Urochloa decumbens TaxID=240449 RepID=A0ABC9BNG8_9POAL